MTIQKWGVDPTCSTSVNTANGLQIADCSKEIHLTKAEKEFNAILIANAPKMLEALRAIRDSFWTDGETGEEKVINLKDLAERTLMEIENA